MFGVPPFSSGLFSRHQNWEQKIDAAASCLTSDLPQPCEGWDGKPIPFWLYKLHGMGISTCTFFVDGKRHQNGSKGMSEILWVHFVLYNFILEEEIRTAGWNRNDEWLLVEETKWNSVLQVTLVLFVPKFGFWDLYFDKVHQTSRSFFVATHEICTAEAAHQGIEYKCEICPKAQPICVSAMPWFAMIGPPWHSKLGGGSFLFFVFHKGFFLTVVAQLNIHKTDIYTQETTWVLVENSEVVR